MLLINHLHFLSLDLLWPVLRGDQPVQAVPDLHQPRGADVHRQAEERGAAPPLCHLRRRLPAGMEIYDW